MSTSIKIDHNIPVTRKHNPRNKYPFDEMEVGDSFFIPTKHRSTGYYYLAKYHSKGTKKFEGRSFVQDGVKGLRIWRTR